MASNCLGSHTENEKLEITPKPNWLELPKDITINILQRLGTLELVTSASVVCPLWWNICKDPHMWRTIDMITCISLSYSDSSYSSRLREICCYAVDRSCGQLKDIYIKIFGNDDLLLDIANRCCPLLKSLKYSSCTEVVGENECDDVALAIANTMSNLRHLAILNNHLTNNGLLAILDGCPLLESLDVRGCIHLDLEGDLGKRCNAQIKELRFPAESIEENFDFEEYLTCYIQDIYGMHFDMGDYDISWINEIPEIDISDMEFY